MEYYLLHAHESWPAVDLPRRASTARSSRMGRRLSSVSREGAWGQAVTGTITGLTEISLRGLQGNCCGIASAWGPKKDFKCLGESRIRPAWDFLQEKIGVQTMQGSTSHNTSNMSVGICILCVWGLGSGLAGVFGWGQDFGDWDFYSCLRLETQECLLDLPEFSARSLHETQVYETSAAP